jgi:nitrogen fixation/metabolism regulation signal transduction histidine kinase
MKNLKKRPQLSILNFKVLIIIYILLCVITVLFSRFFFTETLNEGHVPSRLSVVAVFTIPAVLIIFLGIAAANLIGDIINRRPGIKFQTRLLGYFIIIAIFTAAPMAIVTGVSLNAIIRFWRSIDADTAKAASRLFAVDSYSFQIEKFEKILKTINWDGTMQTPLPAGIACVQDFRSGEGGWKEAAFAGNESGRLSAPPSLTEGYVMRETPRDTGLVRYTKLTSRDGLRLISYDLGVEFDKGLTAIEHQGERFEIIGMLHDNLQALSFFYYGVLFFPTLLMTIIIAISFTRRVTNPITELTEATRRVAEGDFSIQILARRGDELGLLIRSFNAMVQDLEKSRAALVKAEKISIWQNMAQQLAHEKKNPLTPIKLSAERVLRRWRNEPENVGEIVEDSMLAIIQETEGLSTLLNEFRILSKPMEPSQSWTKVREAAEDVIGIYRGSYPEVSFNIEQIAGDVSIRMDKNRFSQVLTNLIVNAIAAMGGKGFLLCLTNSGLYQSRWNRLKHGRFCANL